MKLKIALLSVAMSSAYIFSGSVFAAEKYEIALVAKVNGIPWFNRMGVGVKEAADKLNVNGVSLEIGNFCTLSALFNQSWFVRG